MAKNRRNKNAKAQAAKVASPEQAPNKPAQAEHPNAEPQGSGQESPSPEQLHDAQAHQVGAHAQRERDLHEVEIQQVPQRRVRIVTSQGPGKLESDGRRFADSLLGVTGLNAAITLGIIALCFQLLGDIIDLRVERKVIAELPKSVQDATSKVISDERFQQDLGAAFANWLEQSGRGDVDALVRDETRVLTKNAINTLTNQASTRDVMLECLREVLSENNGQALQSTVQRQLEDVLPSLPSTLIADQAWLAGLQESVREFVEEDSGKRALTAAVAEHLQSDGGQSGLKGVVQKSVDAANDKALEQRVAAAIQSILEGPDGADIFARSIAKNLEWGRLIARSTADQLFVSLRAPQDESQQLWALRMVGVTSTDRSRVVEACLWCAANGAPSVRVESIRLLSYETLLDTQARELASVIVGSADSDAVHAEFDGLLSRQPSLVPFLIEPLSDGRLRGKKAAICLRALANIGTAESIDAACSAYRYLEGDLDCDYWAVVSNIDGRRLAPAVRTKLTVWLFQAAVGALEARTPASFGHRTGVVLDHKDELWIVRSRDGNLRFRKRVSGQHLEVGQAILIDDSPIPAGPLRALLGAMTPHDVPALLIHITDPPRGGDHHAELVDAMLGVCAVVLDRGEVTSSAELRIRESVGSALRRVPMGSRGLGCRAALSWMLSSGSPAQLAEYLAGVNPATELVETDVGYYEEILGDLLTLNVRTPLDHAIDRLRNSGPSSVGRLTMEQTVNSLLSRCEPIASADSSDARLRGLLRSLPTAVELGYEPALRIVHLMLERSGRVATNAECDTQAAAIAMLGLVPPVEIPRAVEVILSCLDAQDGMIGDAENLAANPVHTMFTVAENTLVELVLRSPPCGGGIANEIIDSQSAVGAGLRSFDERAEYRIHLVGALLRTGDRAAVELLLREMELAKTEYDVARVLEQLVHYRGALSQAGLRATMWPIVRDPFDLPDASSRAQHVSEWRAWLESNRKLLDSMQANLEVILRAKAAPK